MGHQPVNNWLSTNGQWKTVLSLSHNLTMEILSTTCIIPACLNNNLPNLPKEIMLPSGHITPPSGCIILPLGNLNLRSTASLRQDNAPLKWNVAFRHYNFLCLSGQVVTISHCKQYEVNGIQSNLGCSGYLNLNPRTIRGALYNREVAKCSSSQCLLEFW